MNSDIVEKLTALNDFEQTDLGEIKGGELSAYAGQAAISVLISNWRDAMRDGETLGSMLSGDIDGVVQHLLTFKRVVTNGLGARMDEVQAPTTSRGP